MIWIGCVRDWSRGNSEASLIFKVPFIAEDTLRLDDFVQHIGIADEVRRNFELVRIVSTTELEKTGTVVRPGLGFKKLASI